jgi:hypothetical protein
MKLSFRSQDEGEMERPPTQRDQFNNDDVELVDALVREALQNSLDARVNGDVVQVRFSLHQPSAAEAESLRSFLDVEELRTRLQACSLLPEGLDLNQPKLLVVEDFGTTGLTGSWNSWDKQPFSDFWRRMGKSHKAGKSLGRWGLGKLVFSSSSNARVFYGLTVQREDASKALLMGQAVLTNHDLHGERFDSHGFYCVLGDKGLQLPLTDRQELERFSSACGLTRVDQPGLSIVVPYVQSTVTEQRIIQATLRNYFFPILLGRLVVTVGSDTIDASSFASLAKAQGGPRFANGLLAQFITCMREVRNGDVQPLALKANWHGVGIAGALGDDVKALRDRFQKGECLSLRVPLLLKQKNGAELSSTFDLFLQKTAAESDTLFVRDTIVLPAEAKYFRGQHVLAALVADDKHICTFLGDAENPAHTSWSATTEKVMAEWRNPSARLKEVRGALQQFYDEIVSSLEIFEPNALIDFFSAKSDVGARGMRPKGPIVRPTTIGKPKAKDKAYRLVRLKGGFAIRPTALLTPDQLPLVIRVRAAYDVLRGNPFSKHDPLDFDFSNDELDIVSKDAAVTSQGPNTLVIKVNARDFDVAVSGFDVKRDLIIDAVRQ